MQQRNRFRLPLLQLFHNRPAPAGSAWTAGSASAGAWAASKVVT